VSPITCSGCGAEQPAEEWPYGSAQAVMLPEGWVIDWTCRNCPRPRCVFAEDPEPRIVDTERKEQP
jgi:hypothetical protein